MVCWPGVSLQLPSCVLFKGQVAARNKIRRLVLRVAIHTGLNLATRRDGVASTVKSEELPIAQLWIAQFAASSHRSPSRECSL